MSEPFDGIIKGWIPSAEEKSYEKELADLRAKLAAAEANNEALNAHIDKLEAVSKALVEGALKAEAELSALREDKARLDWLETCFEEFYWNGDFPSPQEDLRQAIDAGRKGCK